MSRIVLPLEQVRTVASQFKQASSQSQQVVSTIQSAVNNLNANWEGMTQQRFYQEYEQWRTSMTQFVELLNQIGVELDAIAERFAAADQQG